MSSNGNKKRQHGGHREGSGRPRKLNPDDYLQVTCVLRKDTVEKLRAGAGGKHKFFGAFLQFHLDRYPLPTYQEYMAMRDHLPMLKAVGPKRRKIPVIFGGNVARAQRGGPTRRRREIDPVTLKFLREFKLV